jgi:hypothetical protein
MSSFFGNMMIALRTGISATTLTAVANATTSSVTASVSGGRGVYTYLWTSSGTVCTITTPTAATTTFTGSSTAGSTSVYCAITDTITGNTLNTPTCGITWTAVPVSQNVVIGGGPVIYNTLARSYTLTGTPATPVPTGNPPQFINAGTYTSSQITVTPGSGYVLGSVTGSFVISRAPITGMSFTLNGVAFTTAQSRTAGAGPYTIAVSSGSVTPSGATYSPTSLTANTAGSYSLSCSGTVNYTGTRTSPVLTLVTGSVNETGNRTSGNSAQLTATLTGATATGYAWSRIGGTWAGAATISPSGGNPVQASVSASAPTGSNTIFQCIISYTGGSVTPTRTITWGLL